MMDTSETYIKMCDCAEIHNLRSHKADGHSYNHRHIWLPRQDQLQEMVSHVDGGTTIDAFMLHSFLPFCHDEMTLWGSMEQLWLAFAMKEKYNKTWTGDKWVKQ